MTSNPRTHELVRVKRRAIRYEEVIFLVRIVFACRLARSSRMATSAPSPSSASASALSASSAGCPFIRVLYLHFVLLLALFTSCETTATTTRGACPLSRLQAAFQTPFNSLSMVLHGQKTTAPMSDSLSARDGSSAFSDRSSNTGAPRWVTEGVRSRVRSRTVDVQPLGMSAVETKPGSKRAAEEEPEETKESKAQKKARRMAASSTPLSIHVVGLSHHNTGVDVREKLAVPEAEWNLASAKVRGSPPGSGQMRPVTS